MIKVTLITNSGSGAPVEIPVVGGTLLKDFLNVSFEGNSNDFKIRVRTDGESRDEGMDYVLKDNDRISLSPNKIEGAR